MNEPINGVRQPTITLELPADATTDTLKTNYYYTDSVASSVVFTLLSPSIITGTTQYKVVITLNNVAITEHKANVSGSGPIMATITGCATAVGSTEPLTVQVIDNQATAY
jgi:hypothetical protein